MNDNDPWQFVVFIVGKFPMQNHKLGTLTKDPPHPEQRQCFDLCEHEIFLRYICSSNNGTKCEASSGGRRRTAAINPPFPPSSKDTAGENRGRLLATNPHGPTSRCLISRRSVIAGH
ncbi:hypothetical protein T05_5354 [Trichinella murrelli]|uniref:Uncharacterized protein n=1 Tax=Trichinella murrelli TaxID=144512 RepID=A0A0V0TD77_9BILA|nr:hypothetical protein T05_5354 [Trichinella murrelli]